MEAMILFGPQKRFPPISWPPIEVVDFPTRWIDEHTHSITFHTRLVRPMIVAGAAGQCLPGGTKIPFHQR